MPWPAGARPHAGDLADDDEWSELLLCLHDAAVEIRPARLDDRDAIVSLVRAAFAHDDGGRAEVDIVEQTWALDAAADGYDLVAVDGDEVVGHVLAAAGDLDGRPLLGIAPLAVRPDRQGAGIGSALMEDLLRRAGEAGVPLLVLLGSPDYYGRFGFEPAGPLGITYEPVGPDSPYFQARRLGAYDPSHRGTFAYCWERR